ncbi:adenylosuccinate synthetase [Sulfodiicoccus acidiphilus]|uniref:Adenylosuccinate synthetase n=1 Tax=Sulfodiicoccus acidiphilus TaxID=1670455 RepID=A0A348B0C5_9CREN|nr:adenylosuccinate synthetase [Sulfodiicoccus acidiphilus]BBD71627.1 adenylosuccinate synthetase [Sulfodiicoccus acidiphilus]GGT86995.1 adenylosuccinate synthetase [Sulfodiicoccus acidiphilus]
MLQIVVGGFFGDEGKGKVASYLALKDSPAASVRTGSINAGHTVTHNGQSWKVRIIPSAFANKKVRLLLGPGALTSLNLLVTEMENTGTRGRVGIDPHVGIITEEEIEQERNDEYLVKRIGSTAQGVGYAEAKRVLRKLRLAGEYSEVKDLIIDVPSTVVDYVERGSKVLIEGTQGHYLSLYHGDYPYVTSRNVTASGILSEVGVGPKYVKDVIIVFKSFVTRVGQGELPGEIEEEKAKELGLIEVGTVTGRRRRVSPFNVEMAKRAIRINGATQVCITKLDWLFKEAHNVVEETKLSKEAKLWIDDIESQLGVPITLIGTGEESLSMIDMRREKGFEI